MGNETLRTVLSKGAFLFSEGPLSYRYVQRYPALVGYYCFMTYTPSLYKPWLHFMSVKRDQQSAMVYWCIEQPIIQVCAYCQRSTMKPLNNGHVLDPLFSGHFVLCREVVLWFRCYWRRRGLRMKSS